MARYATVDGIHTRLPYIGSHSTLSSADTVTYIDDAEAMMEAKVAKQYSIPISDSPLFNKLAHETAIHQILVQRIFTGERQNQSEWVQMFGKAWEVIDKIADGEIPLLTSSGDLVSTRDNVKEVWSNTKDYLPTFHEAGRLDQVQDEDKLEDLRDDRDL